MASSEDAPRRAVITNAAISREMKRKDRGERVTLADATETGLKVVLNAKTASYVYDFRRRGKTPSGGRWPQRRILIGSPATMTPHEARAKVAAIKEIVRAGGDPAEDRAAEARARRRETTIGIEVARYLGGGLTGSLKYRENEASHLEKAVAELGMASASPNSLRVADLKSLLRLHHGRPATQQHRLGALRRFLDDLVDEEILEVNVAKMLGRRSRPKPPPPRTGRPTAPELQALWNAEISQVRQRYLRAMILIPLRAGEMAELRAANIDRARSAITLGHLETKNGEPFAIPIPSSAMELFEEGDGDRLFQMNGRGGPMNAWTPLRRSIQAKSGVGAFNLHDLRRLFSSELVDHGAGDPDLVDSLLNHKQAATRGGVVAHYQQSSRWTAKVRIMARWAEIVAHAVETGRWPREELAAGADVYRLRSDGS